MVISSLFTLIICLIFIFIPFIPLIILVSPLNQMLIMGINNGIERDIFRPFDKLNLKNIYNFKDFINENFYDLEYDDQTNIYNLCIKAVKGFFLHILTGFLYLFLLVILILNIFLNFILEDKITFIDQILIIFSLGLPFSILYLIPFLKIIKKTKLANFIENIIIKLLRFPDLTVEYMWKSLVIVLKFLILTFYMIISIYLWNLISQNFEVRLDILYYFGCLCIYHYGINFLLGTLFNKLDRKGYPNISLKHSRKLQKNFNCLAMFIIYIIAYLIKLESLSIVIAITLIFLIDTFISDRQKIIEEYSNNHS